MLDARVSAGVCYFATDIHSHGLGKGLEDDSLSWARDIGGELVMVCPVLSCPVGMGTECEQEIGILGS